jgi:hypothetical protein
MADYGFAYPDDFVRYLPERRYFEDERTAEVAADIRNGLEEHYVKNTAWMLRKAWHRGQESRAFEQTKASNDVVLTIARDVMPLWVLVEMPVWVKKQMYWYILLLNHLWEICLTEQFNEVVPIKRRANRTDFVNSDMRTDTMHFIGTLSEPGRIMLRRGYLFPIGGPGAQMEGIRRIAAHYSERYYTESFRNGRNRYRIRLEYARHVCHTAVVLDEYLECLGEDGPSFFLAQTSASLAVRHCHQRFQQFAQGQSIVNERLEISRCVKEEHKNASNYHHNWNLIEAALTSMAGDLGIPRVEEMAIRVNQEHVKTAVLRAAGVHEMDDDAAITLPAHFKRCQKFVEQVMFHGGSPREPQTGLTRGTLKGSRWVPLFSMVQSMTGAMFWNEDGHWMWDENGTVNGRPLLDPRRLVADYHEPPDYQSS